jgi:hypothetical protein
MHHHKEAQRWANTRVDARRCDNKNEVPPRDPNEGTLATWDAGGKLRRKKMFEVKGPVEASESDGRQRRQIKETLTTRWISQVAQWRENGYAPGAHTPHVPSCHQEVYLFSVLRHI